jgi:hypothetical protein
MAFMEHSDEYEIDMIVKKTIQNCLDEANSLKPDIQFSQKAIEIANQAPQDTCDNCLWHTLTSFGLDECICDILVSEGNCSQCLCYGEYCICDNS